MMVTIIVVVAVLASVISEVLFFRWWIRNLRKEAIEFLRQALKGQKVIFVEDCNFLGQLSQRRGRITGNGLLALTEEGLGFRMLFPRRYIFIPLNSVRQVSIVNSFMGKTKGKGILRVDFYGDEGADDACSWLVSSLEWWTQALNSLLSGNQPPETPKM